MSEWISVNEQLPEIDVRVIAYYDGDYEFLLFNGDFWTRKAWPVGYIPTHWMPLPSAPNKK